MSFSIFSGQNEVIQFFKEEESTLAQRSLLKSKNTCPCRSTPALSIESFQFSLVVDLGQRSAKLDQIKKFFSKLKAKELNRESILTEIKTLNLSR